MRANQRFRIVDTRENKVYKQDIESEDVLFFLDHSGNVHKRELKDNVVVMGIVEGYKPIYSLGIFDKNFIEIYEGDIVCEEYKDRDGTVKPYYYVAIYNDELLSYGFIDYGDDFTPFNHSIGIETEDIAKWYKVVGNVYEDDLEKYWEIDRNWKGEE